LRRRHGCAPGRLSLGAALPQNQARRRHTKARARRRLAHQQGTHQKAHTDVKLAFASVWWHMLSSININKGGGGSEAEGSRPGCVSIVMGLPSQMVVGIRRPLEARHSIFPEENQKEQRQKGQKIDTLLDLCVSSLRRGHAIFFCIVPILTDDLRRESKSRSARNGTCSFALPIKALQR